MYCADMQADSCGYCDDEEAADGSIITNGESESEDDRSGKPLLLHARHSKARSIVLEWLTSHCVTQTPINSLSNYRFDNINLEEDDDEDRCLADGQKERQSLLPF